MLSRPFRVRPAPQSARSQQRIVRPGDAQQPECDYNRAGQQLEYYHDPSRQSSPRMQRRVLHGSKEDTFRLSLHTLGFYRWHYRRRRLSR
jgi:hypothetical protein